MNDEQKRLLTDWQNNFQIFIRGHYRAASSCQAMNVRLGVPTVVITTLVGTGTFATLSEDPDPTIKVLAALFSLLAAALATLQTFMKYSERAEKHRTSAARFAALHKEAAQILAMPPNEHTELEKNVSALRQSWDTLSLESPTIPPEIYDAARKTVLVGQSGAQQSGG